MAKRNVPLAPVVKTMSPTFRRINDFGGPPPMECWKAVTTDGVWSIDRIETTGTPWDLTHRPTRTIVDSFGTLRAARAAIASGVYTDQYIALIQARQAVPYGDRDGEWAAQRAINEYIQEWVAEHGPVVA